MSCWESSIWPASVIRTGLAIAHAHRNTAMLNSESGMLIMTAAEASISGLEPRRDAASDAGHAGVGSIAVPANLRQQGSGSKREEGHLGLLDLLADHEQELDQLRMHAALVAAGNDVQVPPSVPALQVAGYGLCHRAGF